MKLTQIAMVVGMMSTFAAPLASASKVTDAYQKYQQSVNQGNVQQALEYARQAVNLGEQAYTADSQDWLSLNYNLASAYSNAKQFKNAVNQYDKVIALSEELFGEDDIRTIAAQLDLARTLYEQKASGQQRTGNQSHQRIIKDLIVGLDEVAEKHPEQAADVYFLITSQMMAIAPMAVSEKRAELTLTKAVSLAKETWGDNDTRTIDQVFMLGRVQFAKNDFNKAIGNFEYIVSVLDNALEYSHPLTLKAHAMLSEAYRRTDNDELAQLHSNKISELSPWQNEIEPIPLMVFKPAYPNDGQRLKEEATVNISFDLNEQGKVVNAKVIGVEGNDYFAGPALAAVKEWRYTPKITDGLPAVTEGMTVNINFEAKNTVSNSEFSGHYLNRYGEWVSFDDNDNIDSAAYRIKPKKQSGH